VETFNYLIGLYVEHEEWPAENLCIVKGTTRDGERALIIWRNVAEVDSEKLNTIFAGMEDKSFDRIYVNGDNNLDNLRTDADIWKVSLTEETFKHKMFEEE
jgi:adenine-specific DNA-methyltransferase